LNFNELDLKKIFSYNSIFLNLLNSEVLNNQNLNSKININFNKVKSLNYLKDIVLKTYFEQGNINLQSSTMNWNDSIIINLNDAQVFNQNNKFSMAGSITFNFTDIDKFYRHYQIKRNYRKRIKSIKLDFLFNLGENEIQLDNIKIKNSDAIFQFLLTPKRYRTNLKKIDLNFVYNFDQNILNLNNIRIDKHQTKKIDKILNNLIFKGNKLQNKVYLKSKFNKALKAYAG